MIAFEKVLVFDVDHEKYEDMKLLSRHREIK
jgi:hypothetical protein